MNRHAIRLKRIYDKPAPQDGARFLVERLWPRGLRKAALRMDDWLRDAAPSTELRRWFHHDSARWSEFRRRYWSELDAHPGAWSGLAKKARRGRITLLYSARDLRHNNAVVLRDYLCVRLGSRTRDLRATDAATEAEPSARAATGRKGR